MYEVKAPWVTTPGHYDLTFSITAGETSDLLIGRLDILAPLAAEPEHNTVWDHIIPHGMELPHLPVWMLAGTLGIAVLLSLLAVKGPRAVRTVFIMAAAVSGISTVAMAAVLLTNSARETGESEAIGQAVLDLPETSRRRGRCGVRSKANAEVTRRYDRRKLQGGDSSKDDPAYWPSHSRPQQERCRAIFASWTD